MKERRNFQATTRHTWSRFHLILQIVCKGVAGLLATNSYEELKPCRNNQGGSGVGRFVDGVRLIGKFGTYKLYNDFRRKEKRLLFHSYT